MFMHSCHYQVGRLVGLESECESIKWRSPVAQTSLAGLKSHSSCLKTHAPVGELVFNTTCKVHVESREEAEETDFDEFLVVQKIASFSIC